MILVIASTYFGKNVVPFFYGPPVYPVFIRSLFQKAAMATSGAGKPSCSVCLSAFEDPTLLQCGHTFCRRCLREWSKRRPNRPNQLICPECRKTTRLNASGIGGLPQNIEINRFFYSAKHERNEFTKVPRDDTHENKGRGPPCSIHSGEFKDMFCENAWCRMKICPQCLDKDHKGHVFKSRRRFIEEQEALDKGIETRCKETKNSIRRKISAVERRREGVDTALRKIKEDILAAWEEKKMLLEKCKDNLMERAVTMEADYRSNLDDMLDCYTQKIEDIDKSFNLIAESNLNDLEKEALHAHVNQRKTVDNILRKPVNEDSAMDVEVAAKAVRFHKSGSDLLTLGKVHGKRADLCKEMSYIEKGMRYIGREIGVTLPTRVVREVRVESGKIETMATVTKNTVALGYGRHRNGADAVSVSGNKTEFLKGSVGQVAGITVLNDRKSIVYDGDGDLSLFDAEGSVLESNVFVLDRSPCAIQSDQYNNIYAVDGGKEISVFMFDHRKQQRSIVTEDSNHQQICVTSTGFIITSTCHLYPSTVTVYDNMGVKLSSLIAESSEHFYVAVDSEDNVTLARVQDSVIRMSFCNLKDNRLLERTRYKQLDLYENDRSTSCLKWNFVSLTPNLVALARGTTLYFIQI